VVHQPVIKPDVRRLNNVVGKHAVGLYYGVTRVPLPPSYGTFVLPVSGFNKIPPEDRPHWERVVETALGDAVRSVGGEGVFRFGFNVAHDNPYGFTAVLLYFDNFVYAVRSYMRPIANPSA
jgi:hypothetical protein